MQIGIFAMSHGAPITSRVARIAMASAVAMVLAACGERRLNPVDVCCDDDVIGMDATAVSNDAGDSGSPDSTDASETGDVAGTVPDCATAGIRFERYDLDSVYRNEGVGAFDVSGDGQPDIVTDQFWYDGHRLAAQELVRHPIGTAREYDPRTQYAVGFGAYALDVNQDGCADVIATPHVNDPFAWYENPCGHGDSWVRREIEPAGVAGLETPFATDQLFADHRVAIVSSDSRIGVLGWYERPADPNGPWELHPISLPNFAGAGAYVHGIGVGDVNGDGLADVLTGSGWFQQTADTTVWPFHPASFGPDGAACSRMWTYDVNRDGHADVFCSRPHERGIYWYEQRPATAPAEPTFVGNLIDDSVESMHALRLADLDGDGTPEIVSGTRWCAHCGAGLQYPDPATAYVVYYAMRNPGPGVTFDRHVIDCETGVGTAFDIVDVDGDGRLDITTVNKHGLFFYRQVPR